MKDFRLFDITDLVMDEDFARWVYEQRPEDEEAWRMPGLRRIPIST